MESVNGTETCHLCGRPVNAGQRVCACGTVFKRETAPVQDSGEYGHLLPWFGLIGFFIVVWWIISPGMLYYNKMPLYKLYGLVAIVSAVFAMLAAQSLQKKKQNIGLAPEIWFALLILLWPVAMPYFLLAQYRERNPARMKFGWITTALFVGALVVLWTIVRQAPTTWPGQMEFPPIPDGVRFDDENAAFNRPAPNRQHSSLIIPSTAPAPAHTPPAAVASQSAAPMRSEQSAPPYSNSIAGSAPNPAMKSPNQSNASSHNNGQQHGSNAFGASLPPVP